MHIYSRYKMGYGVYKLYFHPVVKFNFYNLFFILYQVVQFFMGIIFSAVIDNNPVSNGYYLLHNVGRKEYGFILSYVFN